MFVNAQVLKREWSLIEKAECWRIGAIEGSVFISDHIRLDNRVVKSVNERKLLEYQHNKKNMSISFFLLYL